MAPVTTDGDARQGQVYRPAPAMARRLAGRLGTSLGVLGFCISLCLLVLWGATIALLDSFGGRRR